MPPEASRGRLSLCTSAEDKLRGIAELDLTRPPRRPARSICLLDSPAQALIGPEGTPYEDGLYYFDFQFPAGYPADPPVRTQATRAAAARCCPSPSLAGRYARQ